MSGVTASLPPEVAEYMQNKKRNELVELEKRYNISIQVKSNASLPPGGGNIEFSTEANGNK